MSDVERDEPARETQTEVDYSSISLDFNLSYVRAQPDDPADYAPEISGTIHATRAEFSDDEDSRIQIGQLTAKLIQLSRARGAGWDLFSALDAPSHHVAECLALFDDSEYTDEIQELFNFEIYPDGILFVEEIRIAREHRGRNAGLHAMHALINTFGEGCSLVICKPFPIQYSSNVNKGNQRAFNAARQKLRKYWSRAGFTRILKTDLYGLCTHFQLPELPQIN